MTGASGASAPIAVESFGEDGEWLVAFGHHNLAAFLAAAEAEATSLYGEPQEIAAEPRHRWMRPILRSDCADDDEFAWKEAEGWHMWTDNPTEPGAEPMTVVGLDL